MKTPKEILLETHRAIEPRLDQLREDVLASELGGAAEAISTKRLNWRNIFTTIPLKLWNELIWPSRRAWAGLAAVWVALAVVHFSQRDSTGSLKTAPDPQMMAEWEEQQKLLAQLVSERTQMAQKTPAVVMPTTPDKSADWFTDKEISVT
jgi:hypothetical protein